MGISLFLELPAIVSYWVVTVMCFVAMGVSTMFVVQIYTLVQTQTPEKQRSAILLRYFQGMNDRKISELYHVSRSAICSRRTRGLRKLKMLLSEGK